MCRECLKEDLVDMRIIYQPIYDYVFSVSNVFFAGKDRIVSSVINMVNGLLIRGEESKGAALFSWVLNELLTENELYVQSIEDQLLKELSSFQCYSIVSYQSDSDCVDYPILSDL